MSQELEHRWCTIDHVVLTAVNTQVFNPRCVEAEERRAIRSRLAFGHPDAFLVLYVGRCLPTSAEACPTISERPNGWTKLKSS